MDVSKLGIKAVAAIGMGICGAVVAGIYQLNEAGEVSLRGFVGIAAAGAGAAALAWAGGKLGLVGGKKDGAA